jgi:hypothetical protein
VSNYSPITPPPELMQQWAAEYWNDPGEPIGNGEKYIATQAAQWGADQELEACCEWLRSKDILEPAIDALRATRRPKPPSLKEQALERLELAKKYVDVEPIRRALEALDD